MKLAAKPAMKRAARKGPAFAFVVEELLDSMIAERVRVRAMFGAHAVYIGPKLHFFLRQRPDKETRRDNGMWVVIEPDHVTSVRKQFPSLRPIEIFAAYASTGGFTHWLNLPDSDDGFEQTALEFCRLVIGGDPRLGKVPKERVRKPRRKQARSF